MKRLADIQDCSLTDIAIAEHEEYVAGGDPATRSLQLRLEANELREIIKRAEAQMSRMADDLRHYRVLALEARSLRKMALHFAMSAGEEKRAAFAQTLLQARKRDAEEISPGSIEVVLQRADKESVEKLALIQAEASLRAQERAALLEKANGGRMG